MKSSKPVLRAEIKGLLEGSFSARAPHSLRGHQPLLQEAVAATIFWFEASDPSRNEALAWRQSEGLAPSIAGFKAVYNTTLGSRVIGLVPPIEFADLTLLHQDLSWPCNSRSESAKTSS